MGFPVDRTQYPRARSTGQQMGPPAPPQAIAVPEEDIGPGIPVQPEPPVYSQDIPAAVEGPLGMMRGFQGFHAAPPSWVPMAGHPVTHRYDKPEFIYTNPAAAQQAAAQYHARLSADTQAEQGYRDYLSRLNAERNANERASIQGQAQRDSLTAQQSEGAANRASAERISTNSELLRQHRQAEADWQANEQAFKNGQQTADMLNKDPKDPNNAKLDRKWVYLNPKTGQWEPRFASKPRPVPPSLLQGNQAGPAVPSQPVPQQLPVPVPPSQQWQQTNPPPPPAPPASWDWPAPAPAPIMASSGVFLPTDAGPMRSSARRRLGPAVAVPAQPQVTSYELPTDEPPAPMIGYYGVPHDEPPAPMISR